jgi:hypothetical protein
MKSFICILLFCKFKKERLPPLKIKILKHFFFAFKVQKGYVEIFLMHL